MITKVYLFLITALLASCASHNPQATPTDGAANACDKTSLQNEIRTLRASVQLKDQQIAQLAEQIENAPPPSPATPPEDPMSALTDYCNVNLFRQIVCGIGGFVGSMSLDQLARACGVHESQPDDAEPTSDCPCSVRRVLFIPCEGD